jgi:hypothetical protein
MTNKPNLNDTFDKEDMEQILDVASATIATTKKILIKTLDDQEFYELQARHCWKLFDNLKTVGFNEEQALMMTMKIVGNKQ